MQYETKKMIPEEPLNVYSVIRSPEIREYYQKNVKLDIWAQKQLILCSYLPMTQKICMVKQLALQGTEQEKKTLLDACTILEECMADIYAPKEPTVFAAAYILPDFDFSEYKFIEISREKEFFATAEELFTSRGYYEDGEYTWVNVLQVPKAGELKKPFDFTLFWFDGQWQVKDIIFGDVEVPEDQTESARWQANYFYDSYTFEHFPLPFEDGSRLKLQTPFMDEPFYGILDSQCMEEYCEWHNWLWDEEEAKVPENNRNRRSCIWLDDQFLNTFSGYSPLDWVERA